MDKPLTVKELAKLCQDEIKKGHGEYSIMMTKAMVIITYGTVS